MHASNVSLKKLRLILKLAGVFVKIFGRFFIYNCRTLKYKEYENNRS